MPTYEYRCSECGHTLEEFQSISASPLVDCPQCGKPGLKRVLGGGAGMIFKGQGFYLTDYRKGGSVGSSSPKKESADGKGSSTPASKPGSDSPKPKSDPKDPGT